MAENKTEHKKRTFTDWLKIMVLLLDEVVVLFLVIILLRFFGVHIPLPIMVFIGLLAGALVFVMHKKVIPTFHKRPVVGSEEMIGMRGRVVEPLAPVGHIMVKNECWKAKSVGENIGIDEEVEIVGRDGLTLKVERKD